MKKFFTAACVLFFLTACGPPTAEELTEDVGLLFETLLECKDKNRTGDADSQLCINFSVADKILSKTHKECRSSSNLSDLCVNHRDMKKQLKELMVEYRSSQES